MSRFSDSDVRSSSSPRSLPIPRPYSSSSPASSSQAKANSPIQRSFKRMKIDFTSDVVCPFCLIGIRQLLFALEKYAIIHPNYPIIPEIRCLPYQLNWYLSETPVDRIEARRKRFGVERADAVQRSMTEKTAAVGLNYAQSGPMSSSHLAHRLQSYALLHYPEHQFNLCIDMLTAYHIDGRHPSDRDLLADLAVKHRIFPDYDFVMAWLDGDECDAEVRRAYVTAHRLGVTGVPFFVFQDRWAASGAMGVDEFVQLLEDIVKREGDGSTTPSPTSTAGSPQKDLAKQAAGIPTGITSPRS